MARSASEFKGIDCKWNSDSDITIFNDSTKEYTHFYFDINATQSKGQAVFHAWNDATNNFDNPYLFIDENGTHCYLSDSLTDTQNGITNNLTDNENKDSRTYARDDFADGPKIESASTWNSGPDHPFIVETGEYFWQTKNGHIAWFYCGLESLAGQKCWNAASRNLVTVSAEQGAIIKSVNTVLTNTINSENNCEGGTLNFIFCPFLKYTRDAVRKLIGESRDGSKSGYLIRLLTIAPLSKDSSETGNLYLVWQAFRNIALGLYTIVFVLIVFGNGLGFDNYQIKKALPKLAAGSLLTFASFFIVQTLVDLSNVIGRGIPALIAGIVPDANINTFNIDLSAAGQSVGILFLILFGLAALVAVIVGIAGLLVRQVIIYTLVMVAPLAFVAWVLPNTEGLFKKWWSNLIKVCMMFPIITAMLAFSLIFTSIISKDSDSTLQLAVTIVPLLALIMIPKTFKWGGDAFLAGASFVAGYATRGTDAAKGLGKSTAANVQNRGVSSMLNRAQARLNTEGDGGMKDKASKAFGRATMGAAILGAGRLPTKRGLRTAAQKAQTYQREQAELEGYHAEYMAGPQLEAAIEDSATKLSRSPYNPSEIARFRALQKRAINTRSVDVLARAKNIIQAEGAPGATQYATISAPNLGDISDIAADAMPSRVDSDTGAITAFDINSISIDKVATQHSSTLKRWLREGPTGTLSKLSDERLGQFNDERVNRRMSPDQLDLIAQEMRRRGLAPVFSTSGKTYQLKPEAAARVAAGEPPSMDSKDWQSV